LCDGVTSILVLFSRNEHVVVAYIGIMDYRPTRQISNEGRPHPVQWLDPSLTREGQLLDLLRRLHELSRDAIRAQRNLSDEMLDGARKGNDKNGGYR
jgi:hypothetical protein